MCELYIGEHIGAVDIQASTRPSLIVNASHRGCYSIPDGVDDSAPGVPINTAVGMLWDNVVRLAQLHLAGSPGSSGVNTRALSGTPTGPGRSAVAIARIVNGTSAVIAIIDHFWVQVEPRDSRSCNACNAAQDHDDHYA